MSFASRQRRSATQESPSSGPVECSYGRCRRHRRCFAHATHTHPWILFISNAQTRGLRFISSAENKKHETQKLARTRGFCIKVYLASLLRSKLDLYSLYWLVKTVHIYTKTNFGVSHDTLRLLLCVGVRAK